MKNRNTTHGSCKEVGDTYISIHPTMTLSLESGLRFPKNQYTVSGFTIVLVEDGKLFEHQWTKGRAYKSINAAKAAAEKGFCQEITWKQSTESGEFLTTTIVGPPHIQKWARKLGKEMKARRQARLQRANK